MHFNKRPDVAFALLKAYADYINSGNQYNLKLLPYEGSDYSKAENLRVRASSLGSCPKKKAYEQLRIDPKLPLTPIENYSSKHLMRQGVQDALPFQEAWEWTFGEYSPARGMGALIEAPITGYKIFDVPLTGKADAIIRFPEPLGDVIVEIKRRDIPKFSGDEFAPPKLSDAYQLMAYGIAMGTDQLFLVTSTRYFPCIWQLCRISNSTGYKIIGYKVNETLTNVTEFEFVAEWNNPTVLNDLGLAAEMKLHYAALIAAFYGDNIDAPIGDPLNDKERGWECLHRHGDAEILKTEKGAKARSERTGEPYVKVGDVFAFPGYVKRRCPHNCHVDTERPVPIFIDAEGKKFFAPLSTEQRHEETEDRLSAGDGV